MTCVLKIKEIKEIIALIHQKYKFDLSDFTYVILKINIEQFCKQHSIISFRALIDRITESNSLFEDLMTAVFCNPLELFRDPAMWRSLRDELLTNFTQNTQYKVWIPLSAEGSDLISFLILRNELNMNDKIHVIYSTPFEFLTKLHEGFVYEERKHNLNLSNYKRFKGGELDQDYFEKQQQNLIFNKKYLKNTTFKVFSENNTETNLKNINLIIYRNKLLKYNKNLQLKTIKNLINRLKTGAYLALGVKEKLEDDKIRKIFTIVNIKESIYKKK